MADPLDILTGRTAPREDDWQATLANIAQVVASIPERRAREAQRQAELQQQAESNDIRRGHLQLEQQGQALKQRTMQIDQAVSQIADQAMVPKEDGSWVMDRSRLMKGFAESPVKIPVEQQTKLLEHVANLEQKTAEYHKSRNDFIAGVANEIIDAGGGEEAAVSGLAWAKKNLRLTDEEIAPLTAMIAQGGDLKPKLRQFRDTISDKYRPKEETLAPGAIRVRGSEVIARNAPLPTTAQLDARYQELKGKDPSELTPAEAAEVKGYEARKSIGAGNTTEAQLDSRYQQLAQKAAMGQPLTPEERAEMTAYQKRKTLVPAAVFGIQAPNRETVRSDKSFTANTARIDRARKPLQDQSERMDRLVASVGAKTPQADALIAPELLSVMAGGSGSGLRMNEAEISRIIGGRSKFEDLKAALNKWSLDPSKALSVTDSQRGQILSLIQEVRQRSKARLSKLDKAASDLVDEEDVQKQRRIVEDALAGLGPDEGKSKKTNPFPEK